jgi:hypothetical protein
MRQYRLEGSQEWLEWYPGLEIQLPYSMYIERRDITSPSWVTHYLAGRYRVNQNSDLDLVSANVTYGGLTTSDQFVNAYTSSDAALIANQSRYAIGTSTLMTGPSNDTFTMSFEQYADILENLIKRIELLEQDNETLKDLLLEKGAI